MSLPAILSKEPFSYKRHRPETTLLYQLIQNNLEQFLIDIESDPNSKGLPPHVVQEFYAFLECGILAYGVLRVKCSDCKHEHLVAFSCKKRGFCPSCGGKKMVETSARLVDHVIPNTSIRQWVISFPMTLRYWMASNPKLVNAVLKTIIKIITKFYTKSGGNTGAITLIQRFGSALNLNLHYHILFIEGYYANNTFVKTPPPTNQDIVKILALITTKITKLLTKQGYQTEGKIHCLLEEEEPFLSNLIAASCKYRIGTGPRKGQKIQKLGCLGNTFNTEENILKGTLCASYKGFSIHAARFIPATARDELEKLCRYITRPAIGEERLSVNSSGNVVLELKTAFTDGTTHVIYTPHEFLEKLAALVPLPRVNLIRFHGVLAPNSKFRSQIIPSAKNTLSLITNHTGTEKSQTWAILLKRVFDIDVTKCHCGGTLRIISAIIRKEDVRKILIHLKIDPDPPAIKPGMHEQLNMDF